ncbi:MAG: hypothetical protein ACPL6F_00850, partial [Anaerolineales bacterium]
GGGSLPKWLPIQTNGPEYANFVDTARELESKYAYNLDKAKEVISTEMESLGAKLVDGKWTYKDKPVTLIFLIRPDGDGTRKPIGDYVANQLESVGFTVDRQYKKSSEASPIWIGSDPTEGQWHLYTAAWSSTVLSRDEKDMFQQMYLPSSIQGLSVFQANQPDPEFQKLGDDLANGNFKTLDERSQMMKKALELALQDSLQVWLIDGKNYSPYSPKVEVTYDLAAGIEGAQIWPYTVRFKDQEGGQLKWAEPDLFTEPWNPIAGSNWAWDQAAVRATTSGGVMYDPYTGLVWPLRIEKGAVTALEGLPVGKTLDWVTLDTAPEIKVPEDAWVDWDAKEQKFITAAELIPMIEEAKAKKTEYETSYAENQPKLEEKASELANGLDYAKLNQDAIKETLQNLAQYLNELTGQTVDLETIFSTEDFSTEVDELISRINSKETPLKPEEKIEAVKEFELSKIQIAPFDSKLEALANRDIKTAKIKSVVTYPADLFKTVKWHDGTNLSPADFVMALIMTFDRAKEDSAIYDEAAVPNFESFMSSFKGVKIVSTDPFVVEYYTDFYYQDAELDVTTLWPNYLLGEAPWEVTAIANLAEANNELTYSADKADAKKLEQTSYVGGPSLEILAKYLDQAAGEAYVPYANTMGQFLTTDEVKARYDSLKKWYGDHGHFWLGTGPYYLDKAFLTEKTLTLKHFDDYPDLADRWSQFGEPKIADVQIEGDAQVKINSEATFDVMINYKDQPYPQSEIKMVKYLLYNAKNEVVTIGQAEAVEDGHFRIVLPADLTAKLEAGSNKIEVAVVPLPVAVPTFASIEFVTIP